MPFRRQADITPTGANRQDPLLGLQERNQRNLLDVLQAATPIIEEMAKVKPETWRSMKGLFTSLESSFGTGVKTLGQGFLAPFNQMQGRIMNMTEGFLAPLMVGINNLGNQFEAMALSNQKGAIGGALAGSLIGSFFGNPMLGAIFGSLIGTALEQFVRDSGIQAYTGGQITGGFPTADSPGVIDTGGNSLTQTTAAGGAIIPHDPFPTTQPGGQFGGRLEQITGRFR